MRRSARVGEVWLVSLEEDGLAPDDMILLVVSEWEESDGGDQEGWLEVLDLLTGHHTALPPDLLAAPLKRLA